MTVQNIGLFTKREHGAVVNMQNAALRRLGMIATSPSWRRYWLPWRWAAYPWRKPR